MAVQAWKHLQALGRSSRSDDVTETFTITANKEVMDKFKKFLAFFCFNGGHSGLFAMDFDGDGADHMIVDPEPADEYRKGVGSLSGIGADIEIATSNGFAGRRLAKDEFKYPYYKVSDDGKEKLKFVSDEDTEGTPI